MQSVLHAPCARFTPAISWSECAIATASQRLLALLCTLCPVSSLCGKSPVAFSPLCSYHGRSGTFMWPTSFSFTVQKHNVMISNCHGKVRFLLESHLSARVLNLRKFQGGVAPFTWLMFQYVPALLLAFCSKSELLIRLFFQSYGTPRSLSVSNTEFSDLEGMFSTMLLMAKRNGFMAVMSDSTGIAFGVVFPVITTCASTSGNKCNTIDPGESLRRL